MNDHRILKNARVVGAFAALLALHAVLLAGVLCGVYFSLMLGHWWPVALALAVVVVFDIALLVRRLRSPKRGFRLRSFADVPPSATE